MRCENCKNEITNAKDQFCYFCGAKLNQNTVGQGNQKANLPSVNKSSTGSSGIKYVAAILGASIIIVILGWIIYQKVYSADSTGSGEKPQKTVASSGKNSEGDVGTDEEPEEAKINVIEVNTEEFPIIKVYFSVTNKSSKSISGLNAKHFKVYEMIGDNSNKEKVNISDFRTLSAEEVSKFNKQKSVYCLTYTTSNTEVSSDLTTVNINLSYDEYSAKADTKFVPTEALMEAKLKKKEYVDSMQKDIGALLNSEKGEYGVGYLNLKDDSAMYFNSKQSKAASVIKIYVMIEAFDKMRQGAMDGNEEITLTKEMKVGGTGILAGQPNGTRISINNLIELMIIDSDNTAANILIDRLGMDNINKTAARLGCTNTYLQRKMMDFDSAKQGRENYTSINDLCLTLRKIYKNECLGGEYDKKMIEIMIKQKNNTKIPATLPPNVQVAHKTGELEGVENDAAIVFCPEGDYVLCILTEGANSGNAIKKNGEISKIVYEYNNKINGK